MDMGFKDKDIQTIVDFLNFVATKAAFSNITLEDNIKLFRMLNYLQVELLPKIDRHLVEDIKITQITKPEEGSN